MGKFQPYIVRYSKFKYTRLIDSEEKYYKSIAVWEAKKIAESVGLNLVCFNEPDRNELALCKIIDFGKWRYNNEKNSKKINNTHNETKEIRFSPNIDQHDLEHKIKHCNEFLSKGHEVVILMRAFGRDLSHMDLVEEKTKIIESRLSEIGKIINKKREGNKIFIRVVRKTT